MSRAAPAAREVWRARPQIALWTPSAIASDGMRLDTDRSHWESPAPFPTRFASSPKGTFDLAAATRLPDHTARPPDIPGKSPVELGGSNAPGTGAAAFLPNICLKGLGLPGFR